MSFESFHPALRGLIPQNIDLDSLLLNGGQIPISPISMNRTIEPLPFTIQFSTGGGIFRFRDIFNLFPKQFDPTSSSVSNFLVKKALWNTKVVRTTVNKQEFWIPTPHCVFSVSSVRASSVGGNYISLDLFDFVSNNAARSVPTIVTRYSAFGSPRNSPALGVVLPHKYATFQVDSQSTDMSSDLFRITLSKGVRATVLVDILFLPSGSKRLTSIEVLEPDSDAHLVLRSSF